MADVEACSPPVDPSRGCSNKPLRTILHVVMVITLFSLIMFAYYIYLGSRSIHDCSSDKSYAVAPLVIQIIAYLALGCLYIYHSSCLQDKFIFAGYLVLVMFVFIFECPDYSRDTYLIEPISWANMVAISSYCIWRFSFILPYCRPKKLVRTILHGAIVTILLVVIIYSYRLYRAYVHVPHHQYNFGPDDGYCWAYYIITDKVWLLIQSAAYNAIAFLYICNFSGRKEKVVFGGLLVLVLLVFLVCSSAKITKNIRTDLIFAANMVALSSYCIWKLFLWTRAICPRTGALDAQAIRGWWDALDDHMETEPQPREPARQQEEAVLRRLQVVQQIPFRIQDMPKEFSSDEIQSITQDFGNRIGQGGSAQVFRGSLDDGTAVAVKRIHMHSGRTEAGEEEFRREVSIIATVHHRSLVRLLGYCLHHGDGGGLYLVYPFFENGSLDRWIFSRSDEQRQLLTWPKRLCVAVDVARALAYLHRDCRRRILHLDVKPGNILLDGDHRAHVSDFGISLSTTRDLTSVINTRGRGTFGYMAPEMLINAVSDRSDVFSYGMTLLELVGGRRNFDPSSAATPDPNLARNLREKMAHGEHMELVDAAMEVAAADDVAAVKTVLMVALCCIQHERDLRPSMQNVVDMLEGRVAVDLPPVPETRRPSSSAVNLLEPHSISEHGVSDVHGG